MFLTSTGYLEIIILELNSQIYSGCEETSRGCRQDYTKQTILKKILKNDESEGKQFKDRTV